MRGKTREANPKRRRSAPDDRAVLIAALVFSCEAALSSQRKIRGSRKRGYKKPQVSCTPFCPSPREGRVPAAEGGQKGTRPPRAKLPRPGEWGQPRLLRLRRSIGGKFRALPRRENKARALRGHNPRLLRETRSIGGKFRALPRRENKALALRGRNSPGRVQLLRFSQQGEPQ